MKYKEWVKWMGYFEWFLAILGTVFMAVGIVVNEITGDKSLIFTSIAFLLTYLLAAAVFNLLKSKYKPNQNRERKKN
jgi:hypothetical protein